MPKRISVDDQEPSVNKTENVVLPVASENVSVDVSAPKSTSKSGVPPTNSSVDLELESKSGHSPLSAFMANPPGIFFVGKEPQENLILLLRAHVITTVPWILITIALVLIPIIVIPLLLSIASLPLIPTGLGVVLTLLWYLGTFTYAFLNFLYWYFNIYIITDERIIDVDWYSIVIRKVSSTQIAKVQDATSQQIGVLAGIFDFGDVLIQTAGTEENFKFASVPHPQLVAKKIEELIQIEEEENGSRPV